MFSLPLPLLRVFSFSLLFSVFFLPLLSPLCFSSSFPLVYFPYSSPLSGEFPLSFPTLMCFLKSPTPSPLPCPTYVSPPPTLSWACLLSLSLFQVFPSPFLCSCGFPPLPLRCILATLYLFCFVSHLFIYF